MGWHVVKIYRQNQESIKNEAIFTKRESKNEYNINFL